MTSKKKPRGRAPTIKRAATHRPVPDNRAAISSLVELLIRRIDECTPSMLSDLEAAVRKIRRQHP